MEGGLFAVVPNLTMSNTVKIVSENYQGLSDPRKRRDVFHKTKIILYISIAGYSFCPQTENCIRASSGYKSYFASYNSNSRGVAILFNNNLEFLVKKSVQGYFRKLHIYYCNNNG